MQREAVDRANKILKLIMEHEKAIKLLKYFMEDGCQLFIFGTKYDRIEFEPWEIRLIIHNKKQRIAALERELEEL